MRSKKHPGSWGGSCHIGKKFKCDSKANQRKDCLKMNATFIEVKSSTKQVFHKRQTKKARQFNHLEFEDIEDIPFYISF